MRYLAVLGLVLLAGCGVDGAPVPPGQDNPAATNDLSKINGSGYF